MEPYKNFRSDSQFQHEESGHGGPGWIPRTTALHEELGTVWGPCGVHSEYGKLRSVLLHRPGREVDGLRTPKNALFIESICMDLAQSQHDSVVAAYIREGVDVHLINPPTHSKPNLYFCRDLFVMTPSGAIVARPASAVRAGEERYVAHALTRLGIPILASIHGDATLEGADVMIVRPGVVLIGEGLRTNRKGAQQAAAIFRELQFEHVEVVQLAFGMGHLDGALNIIDSDLALIRPTQLPYAAWRVLTDLGFQFIHLTNIDEVHSGMSINVVALGPRRIIMPAGNPCTKQALEALGVTCIELDVSELMKGGGALHCMTAPLHREQ